MNTNGGQRKQVIQFARESSSLAVVYEAVPLLGIWRQRRQIVLALGATNEALIMNSFSR
jgi:hypothetical protein